MRTIIIYLFLFLFGIPAFAQIKTEEVTLVVSGDGATKEEATKSALRSAIEQAFGTFVSSNTQILNDDLVRDEIVTVSSGNIKSYKYLSEIERSGKYYVTLNANVSIGKLISYAKSKGSKAEFAGQTFAMNIKLMELREQNTLAAYKNMCVQVGELANDAFEFKIELEDPTIKEYYHYRIKNGELLSSRTTSTSTEGYELTVRIKVIATPVTSLIYTLMNNTINSLKLNDKEVEEYKRVGKRESLYPYVFHVWEEKCIYLPINKSDVEQIEKSDANLIRKIRGALFNYKLVDLSDPENYFVWQQGLEDYFSPRAAGETRDDSGISTYNLLSLVNRRKEASTFLHGSTTGKYLELERGRFFTFDGTNKHYYYDQSYSLRYFGGRDYDDSHERDSYRRQWEKWFLPDANLLKKQKGGKNKNKDKKQLLNNVEEDQLICGYIIPIFIPKDKMSSFQGLSIEKNTTPFVIK